MLFDLVVTSPFKGSGLMEDLRLAQMLRTIKREPNVIIHMVNVNPFIQSTINSIGNKHNLVHIIYCPNTNSFPFKRRISRIAYKPLKAVIVTSERIATETSRISFDMKEKIYVVPPAIDTNLFRPIDSPRDNSVLKILYMGSLGSKRFQIKKVLTSLKLLRDKYKINYVFKGYVRSWPKNYLLSANFNNLALKMHIHAKMNVKNLSIPEKIQLYNWADTLIQPFLRLEACDPPITILEAMSCCVPVVTTPVAQWDGKIVDGKNGFVVEKFDSTSIADKLEQVYTSDRKIRKDARKTVQKYSSNAVIAQKLIRVYQSIIE